MISYEDIVKAKERIQDYIIRTPLLRVPALDEALGCKVYLKPENLQYTGSFKLRGATNRMLTMTSQEKAHGVVCASSGNHAQGVACAAQRLGVDAVIVMPTNCNPMKLAGVKNFGADAVLEGTLSSEREAKAEAFAESEHRILIHPFDDDDVRAGQGTIGIEILEDEPKLDVVVVPIGGGGLISGIATAVKKLNTDIRVIGVEPNGARRYGFSREENRPMKLESVNTIADGTRTNQANPTSYSIIEKNVDALISVSDESIVLAMKKIVSMAKIIAEPSSAMGVAAALDQTLDVTPDDKVCFVITGGNNDLSQLAEIIKG